MLKTILDFLEHMTSTATNYIGREAPKGSLPVVEELTYEEVIKYFVEARKKPENASATCGALLRERQKKLYVVTQMLIDKSEKPLPMSIKSFKTIDFDDELENLFKDKDLILFR